MDAAGAGGGEEVREADEGLGVARGAIFHQGETGGQGCSRLVGGRGWAGPSLELVRLIRQFVHH